MNVRLDSDPRWLRLHDQDWVCSCCGVKHGGLFDLGNEYPHVWSSRPKVRPNSEIRSSRDIQTQDFCVRDNTHFFVRCVLELPIIGSDGERFGYGVWSTLSEQNFEAYLEGFDSGDHGHLGPWFGWFSNQLAGYPDTFNLKCQVYPQDGRKRPYIVLEATEHPLAIEQRKGISFDRLLDIYALYGHDLGKALAN